MTKKLARAIKTERDFKGAAQAAKKMLGQAGRESAEELRLQALIKEMERFDDVGAEEESGDDTEAVYDMPGRRWTDDGSEM